MAKAFAHLDGDGINEGAPFQYPSSACNVSFLPGCQSAIWKGPVPRILPAAVRLAMAFRGSASSPSRFGTGASHSITTESPFGKILHFGLVVRNDAATESPVSGDPS